MEVKTKILLSLMHNNNYFTNLNDYLTEKVEEDKLSYKNLKYMYNKLYLGKSLYLKQNIFPVCQFLIKGYSTEEAERLARLLPDAHKLTVFCYEEKEEGYLYNKLFMDLRFVYLEYDEYIKNGCNKERAFELVKEDIEVTTVKQRQIEVNLKEQEISSKKELEEKCSEIYEQMHNLRDDFEKDTTNDKKLLEYFNDNNTKARFSSIIVAGTILGGIELRNIWRDNGKLEGEKEVFPYSEKQIKMIDQYNRLQETLDKVEWYAEHCLTNGELEEEELE